MGKIKDQAMDYFVRIPDGHKNAIQRPWNRVVDRCLRKMIEKANNNGDCIINVGNGIYRPIPGDPVDEKELNEYLAKELHRARAIQLKRLCMKKTFEGRRDGEGHANPFPEARPAERLHSSRPGKPTSGGEPEGEERKQGIGGDIQAAWAAEDQEAGQDAVQVV